MNESQLFKTNRLNINKINTTEDLVSMIRYHNDSDTMQWIPNKLEHYTLELLQTRLTINNDLYTKGMGIYKVINRDQNLLIGEIGIYTFNNEEDSVEIGYILSKENWRQGYATELLHTTEEYIKNKLGKKKIIAQLIKGNTASENLLLKCNYHFIQEDLISTEVTRLRYEKIIVE